MPFDRARLVAVWITDRNGKKQRRWMRPEGQLPPSQSNEHRRKYYAEVKERVFTLAGGHVCARCGFTDDRALQIDHVNNDGSKDCRGKLGVARYHQILKNWVPGRYQVLCANCNWIKRAEFEANRE